MNANVFDTAGRTGQRKRLVLALCIIFGAALIMTAWFLPATAKPSSVIPESEFCLLAPKEAHASAEDPASVDFRAAVPVIAPDFASTGMTATSARANDVVRVTVSSPHAGQIAVHGLLDPQRVDENGSVTIQFRAIYSGRFPIHFHGDDGSHIEIAAVDVLPSSSSADGDNGRSNRR